MPSPSASDLTLLRRSFERFVTLPDEVWEDLRLPWRLRAVRRGEQLTAIGETERTFALVLDGVQRMSFLGPDGADHTVAFVYPPDYSGVPDSFFLQVPSAYALDAITDGQILAIGHDTLAALLHRHRELDRWRAELFLWAFAGRSKREREHLTMSAPERYARLLRESPQVLQHAPLKHVASYLGMTPETLSRVRAAGS